MYLPRGALAAEDLPKVELGRCVFRAAISSVPCAVANSRPTVLRPPRPIPGSRPCSAVIKGCWQLSGGHKGESSTDRTSGQKAVDDFKAFVDAGITTFDSGPEECGYGPSGGVSNRLSAHSASSRRASSY